MRLAFSSDFRADAPTRGWATTYADGSRGHPDERQVYVDRDYLAATGLGQDLDPFAVRDGALDVTARVIGTAPPGLPRVRFASGLLTTRGTFSFRRGYAEARIRMPSGAGLWPAFWLMREGPAYGEVDVVELLGEHPRTIYQTVHAGPDWSRRVVRQTRTEWPTDLTDGPHTFGVDREADFVTFYVDGIATGSHRTPPDEDAPAYLLLDLAVGGPWGDAPDPAAFPATMTVEQVRVWVPDADGAPPTRTGSMP